VTILPRHDYSNNYLLEAAHEELRRWEPQTLDQVQLESLLDQVPSRRQ
jgi:hypothetical protein